MNQEVLDIRNKISEELIDSYNEIAQNTLNDLNKIKSIDIKEHLEELDNIYQVDNLDKNT